MFDPNEATLQSTSVPTVTQHSKLAVTRRQVLLGATASAALIGFPFPAHADKHPPTLGRGSRRNGEATSDTIIAADGTRIYYKDWGSGQPVVFSHGWPLNADAWDAQMLFLAQHGYRVIAHDRRGHGRSGQSRGGNDLNTYADDLSQLIESLELKKAMLVGHSTGGGEVVRYIGRHGTRRLSKLVLIGSITPTLMQSSTNPSGIPRSAFDEVRTAVAADRSQFLKDLSLPFFGYNKPDAKVSDGVRDEFWRQGMQASMLGTYECIQAQSETDMTDDLRKVDIPTLILHGEQDQLVPLANTAMSGARLISRSTLKIYPGAPHGMTVTQADMVNQDLLAFMQA